MIFWLVLLKLEISYNILKDFGFFERIFWRLYFCMENYLSFHDSCVCVCVCDISENNIIFSVQLAQVLWVDGRKWNGWGFFSSSVSLALFVVFLVSAPCESNSELSCFAPRLLACCPYPPGPFFFPSPQIRWMLFVVCFSPCRGDFYAYSQSIFFGWKSCVLLMSGEKEPGI